MQDDWHTREQLHIAAQDGDLEKVKRLVSEGYDVNAFDDLARTPLHYAAENEHASVVKFLLDAGSDVNAHDEDRIGETPLGQAAKRSSSQIVRLLLDAGADPTIQGWMKLTALDRAEERTDEEGRLVYALLKERLAGRLSN